MLPLTPICPKLGTQQDPETSFSFPSAQNCCWSCSPPRHVHREYQSTTCLTADYTRCPLLPAHPNPPSPTGSLTPPPPEPSSIPTAPDTAFTPSPQRFQDLPLTPSPPHPSDVLCRRSPVPLHFLASLELPLLCLLAFLLTLALLALLSLKY